MLAVAAASILAGAVIAILPALILSLVHLFYDSSGGILILLGNLLKLLPHPAFTPGAGGGLPIFQALEDHVGLVLFRSLTGAVLCSIAFTMLIARRRGWLVAACCCVAGLIAGHGAILALIPAIVFAPAIAVGQFRPTGI
ncbi:MAG TPA: hypothetical protein VHB27_08140 [Rhodopila sp.]|uniref:hypothetical protein n=1 Tax=Rhodopila sp. TaxID=2480087 RepID=UPI002D0F307C|nr:hypothetical protein [Rhodopila sp.]HVY15181.1 hypothetical protein [Rhodopila sp.]